MDNYGHIKVDWNLETYRNINAFNQQKKMTTATTQPTIQHEINCSMAQSLPPPSSSPIHSSSPQIHGLLLSTVTTPPSSTLSYQRSRPLTHTSTAVKVRQRGITPVYFIIIMKIVTPHHLLSSPFLFHRRFCSVKARKWLRSEENCECSNWLWINNKYGFSIVNSLIFSSDFGRRSPPYFEMGC